jgi:hypothetical protein
MVSGIALRKYELPAARSCGPPTESGERGSGLPDQERESSDSPILKAFCRVAPSVRFKLRAILAARVFFRAIVFSVRTSDDVHERRFDLLDI